MQFVEMLKMHKSLEVGQKLKVRHTDGREGVISTAGINSFFVEWFPLTHYTERIIEKVPYSQLEIIGTYPKEVKKKR